MPGSPSCFVCRKEIPSFWVCVVCEQAGRLVHVCSDRCKRVHLRDGRHRSELKAQKNR